MASHYKMAAGSANDAGTQGSSSRPQAGPLDWRLSPSLIRYGPPVFVVVLRSQHHLIWQCCARDAPIELNG